MAAIHATAGRSSDRRYVDQTIYAACGKFSKPNPWQFRRMKLTYAAWNVTCEACKQNGYGLATWTGE